MHVVKRCSPERNTFTHIEAPLAALRPGIFQRFKLGLSYQSFKADTIDRKWPPAAHTIRNYACHPDNFQSRPSLRSQIRRLTIYPIAFSYACFTCVREGS
jgi:hypothetical protein